MELFLKIGMYALWGFSLIGILVVIFTKFQYVDLNVIVTVLFLFTAINTLAYLKNQKWNDKNSV